MDFLSNLASLALGEIPVIKPLLPSLASQSNNDNKYFNEAYREKNISFESNDELKEGQTPHEKNFNSFPTKQIEFQDDEKIIPAQEKRIFPDEKIFSDKSKSISDEIFDLTKSINPVEENIQNNNLTVDTGNGEKPFDNKAVNSKNYVLQSINNLFEDDDTVLKLKKSDNKNENNFEMHPVNPQSKSSKNVLDRKNKNFGFDTDGSNTTKSSTIKINIGRIEVRAVYPEQVIASKTEQNIPQLTLQDYLRSFNEGKR
jgi:hypothetical protein